VPLALAEGGGCVEAATEIERGEKHPDGSREEEESFRRAVELCPDLADAHYNLGVSLSRQSRFAEAESALLRSLSLVDDLNAHLALGNLYAAQKLWSKAGEQYQAVLKKDSQMAEALQGLAVVEKNTGSLTQAEEYLRQAIQSEPRNASLFYNLGIVLEALERDDEAVVSYQTALEKQTNLYAAYLALGSLLLKRERFDEAERILKNATFLDPKNSEGWRLLTAVYEAKGEFSLALSAFERFEGGAGKSNHSVRLRGVLLVKAGREEEGLQTLLRAVSEYPKDGSLAGAVGWAYLQERKFPEARHWLTTALQLKEDDAFSHNNLGALLEAEGDKEGAKREFLRAQELNTKLEAAAKNLKRVEQ
jgi:superkiller protein 3